MGNICRENYLVSLQKYAPDNTNNVLREAVPW